MASIRRSLLSPAESDHRHHHHQSQQRHRLPDHFPATSRDRTRKFKWVYRPIPSNRSLLFFLLLGFFLGLLLLLPLEAGDPAGRPPPPPPPPPPPLLSAADAAGAAAPPKLLLVVTPTYPRALQAYYLTRLAHTLRLVPPPLLWIVVEMGSPDRHTARLLRTAGVAYRHLLSSNRTAGSFKDRGVHQRNTALRHIELHRLDGIVYFADDDNIYSLELFQRIREIRRFGTWPVAMLAESKNKATLEGPVCNGSRVVGWHTNEKSKRLRRFHVDMSGFAFNSTILWDPKRWHRPTSQKIRQLDTVKEGFQETTFIEQLVEDESQMEGIPHGCSRIMNWHLHLEAKGLVYPRGWQLSSNLDISVPLQ